MKPDSVSGVKFTSENLVIFEDDALLETMTSWDISWPSRTRPTLNSQHCFGGISLQELALILVSWGFRCLLKQYFQCDYEILSSLQIHKVNQTCRIQWDPEGQRRLVAQVALHDFTLIVPGGDAVLVKERSMSINVCFPEEMSSTQLTTSRIICPPYCLSIVVSPCTRPGSMIVTFFTQAKTWFFCIMRSENHSDMPRAAFWNPGHALLYFTKPTSQSSTSGAG